MQSLLLAGVVAGPEALGLVRNAHEIELLAEIGVVLLLFVIGLEISLADLERLQRFFGIGGSLQFFGTAAAVGLALLPLGLMPQQSVYLGFISALSSTAIVLRLLQEKGELETPHGRSILSMLLYQDVGVVPVMLTAPLLASAAGLASGGSGSGFQAVAVLLAKVVLVAALGYGAYRWLVPWVLERITRTRSSEAFLLGVFMLCVGIALLTQSLGLSLALGASLAVGLPLRQAVLSGLALAQVGEFSLVATKAGVSADLLDPQIFQTVLAVAVLSMLATPLLIQLAPALAEGLAERLAQTTWGRRLGAIEADLAPPPAASNPHVLIVGYGVTGRNLARSCRRCEVPCTVVELNAALVRQGRGEGLAIEYGDAGHPAILQRARASLARAIVVVIDDPAAARRIVELARRMAPAAYLLVRSRYLREVEPLQHLGADEVIADELEVSIEVFSRVLARMLVPRQQIKELIQDVRGEWRRMARGLAPEATRVHDLRTVLPQLATHTLAIGADHPLTGLTLAASKLREAHGVTVLAVHRSGQTLATPHGDLVLERDDVLFVIGPQEWDPALL